MDPTLCTNCKGKLSFGIKFCPVCGTVVIINETFNYKTTADFDPGSVLNRPWREGCVIPKRKYKENTMLTSKVPWRPIMRQPRMKKLPQELLDKRAAMARRRTAEDEAKETERRNQEYAARPRGEGVVYFDGIPFQKANGFFSEMDYAKEEHDNDEGLGKLSTNATTELFYEHIYALGIYDAVWIVNSCVAVHISLVERGTKYASNNVISSFKRYLQLSVSLDWNDRFVSAGSASADADDSCGIMLLNSTDTADQDGSFTGSLSGDSLSGMDEGASHSPSKILQAQADAHALALAKAETGSLVSSLHQHETDELDGEGTHAVFSLLTNGLGKELVVNKSSWVDLKIISPNEFYMAEHLQGLLEPLAYRVKPIKLIIPIVAKTDQIVVLHCAQTYIKGTRDFLGGASKFDQHGNDISEKGKRFVIKLFPIDVKATYDNLVEVFFGRSTFVENQDDIPPDDNSSVLRRSTGAYIQSSKVDVGFDTTIFQAGFQITVGKHRFNETASCTIRCAIIAKEPTIPVINPETKSCTQYTNPTSIDTIDDIDYIVLTITPLPSASKIRRIRTKVVKMDMRTLVHMCPMVKSRHYFGVENVGVPDIVPHIRRMVRDLVSLMRYENTANGGVRLRFHGITERASYHGRIYRTIAFPHEEEIIRTAGVLQMQSVFRGFRVRLSAWERIQTAIRNDAAIKLQRMFRMCKAKAEATSAMKLIAEQMQAQARIADAKFIDEFLGVAETSTAEAVEDVHVEGQVPTEPEPVLTNEIFTTLQFTNVRMTGQFYINQSKFELEPDNICGCWELAEVKIKDIESGMKCIIEIRPDNDVFSKCISQLDCIVKAADEDGPLLEQNREKRRILYEKEFLKLLIPYLNIFIAREKKVLIVKIKNTLE